MGRGRSESVVGTQNESIFGSKLGWQKFSQKLTNKIKRAIQKCSELRRFSFLPFYPFFLGDFSSLSGSQICESPSSSPANHRIAPPSVHFWAAGCRSTIGEPGTYRFCHHNYHTRTTTYSILYFNLTQFMFSQTDPTFVQQTILYHRASKFLGHHSCPHRPLNFMLKIHFGTTTFASVGIARLGHFVRATSRQIDSHYGRLLNEGGEGLGEGRIRLPIEQKLGIYGVENKIEMLVNPCIMYLYIVIQPAIILLYLKSLPMLNPATTLS